MRVPLADRVSPKNLAAGAPIQKWEVDCQPTGRPDGIRFHLAPDSISTKSIRSCLRMVSIRLSDFPSSFANSSDVIGLCFSAARWPGLFGEVRSECILKQQMRQTAAG